MSTKKPVDLSKFMQNWHEESRMSSPGNGGGLAGYESPKSKFYLNAAKYSHGKRDKRDSNGVPLSGSQNALL